MTPEPATEAGCVEVGHHCGLLLRGSGRASSSGTPSSSDEGDSAGWMDISCVGARVAVAPGLIAEDDDDVRVSPVLAGRRRASRDPNAEVLEPGVAHPSDTPISSPTRPSSSGASPPGSLRMNCLMASANSARVLRTISVPSRVTAW